MNLPVVRSALLGLARNDAARRLAVQLPVTRDVVRRFVPGETPDQMIAAVSALVARGIGVSVDHLGEHTRDPAQAEVVTEAYVDCLDLLAERGLDGAGEVSVKLSAIGQLLSPDGEALALANLRTICHAARNAGAFVTVDMEDHRTTDSTLRIVREVRRDFPSTGAVLQAYLRRSEDDCRALAHEGSRVRLCKGAYAEPSEVAFQKPVAVDRAYVRCLKVLLRGDGYPMIATHDPTMIAIAQDLAVRHGRTLEEYEFQMLYGIRPLEQQRLARLGHRVRVYVPFGSDWWAYFIRRLAERPANLTFFLRSFLGRR